jgi:hypothetical protein
MLAAAIPTGCHTLQQLDVSCNTLSTSFVSSSNSSSSTSGGAGSQHGGGSSSSTGSQHAADQAWSSLFEALAQPCCQQLHTLLLKKCSLGPVAAAALAKLMRARTRCNLQQLELAGCAGMGEVGLRQHWGADSLH